MSTPVVAGCDAEPVLELGKQVLDLLALALAVEGCVVCEKRLSAAARGMHGSMPPGFEFLAESGAVVAAIGDQVIGRRQSAEHETGALVAAHLTFRQKHNDRTTVAVADGV